jgi:hypothetical protein
MKAYTSISNGQHFCTTTKRIKVLKVVGEAVGQLVLDNSTCINAIKIDRVKAFLLKSSDSLFDNKIVKEGIIRKEVFYVDPENRLRFLSEDIPFMLTVDLPGFKPNAFTEVQNHLLDIAVDYILTPARQCIPGCLHQKIVARILVKASEWTQLDVVTNVELYPKVSYAAKRCSCY